MSETKTDALHCMISPPYVRDGHVYGVDSYGQLRCLDAGNGDRVWESVGKIVPEGRWSTVFMVRNRDRTFAFNELGELIIAELTPSGYREIDRAKLIEPTTPLKRRGRTWCGRSRPLRARGCTRATTGSWCAWIFRSSGFAAVQGSGFRVAWDSRRSTI